MSEWFSNNQILVYCAVFSTLQLTRSEVGDAQTAAPPPDTERSANYNTLFPQVHFTHHEEGRHLLRGGWSSTVVPRISFAENCDFLAKYCLKGYETGSVCGRSLYYLYYTFDNYCLLDYVNCMERYQVWQVAHMGACYDLEGPPDFEGVAYHDDYFLEQYYVQN